MKKLTAKSLIITSVASVSMLVFTPFAGAVSIEKEQQKKEVTQIQYQTTVLQNSMTLNKEDPSVNQIADHFNLTKKETTQLKEAIKMVKEKQSSGFTTQGKLSWAVKALKAAWDNIPTKVKAALGGTAGFATLLNVIDNYTGAIEDACYQGALVVTGNPTAAWWISKTLMLFL
ncbi:hypothetical protein [Bacillus sp. C28GYM-DRY-1]|uniref:hypothetical protein n=1 Tax=Bacillus sp. C28GYM-DRY-1 TaxID=3062686 RepID=UPI002675A244|nr:hypothetical protein [Bacillus sp. C28GYM-DRY-1]MDO3660354.1 hypothetical protein [Bacillus sp. C28GYM-DRY-1]